MAADMGASGLSSSISGAWPFQVTQCGSFLLEAGQYETSIIKGKRWETFATLAK